MHQSPPFYLIHSHIIDYSKEENLVNFKKFDWLLTADAM
jgi:hypothetical protein